MTCFHKASSIWWRAPSIGSKARAAIEKVLSCQTKMLWMPANLSLFRGIGPFGEFAEVPDILYYLLVGLLFALLPLLYVAVGKVVEWHDKRQWERERQARLESIGRDVQEYRMKKFKGEI